MYYPSYAEYCEALQLGLGIALSDPLLGRGTLRTHGSGRPVAHSGNFALTFDVSVDGKTYAVRCFHKHSDSLQARYDAIASCLRSIRSPYFVDFEFQPSGITTESGTYPIVRMEWAEGQTLAEFVANHRNDVNALKTLRVSLRELAKHLQEHGIAHGDIQPTNVIVQSATNLRLIDYDGMFVPQILPLRSAELGQRNFQHPGRRAWHYDADLDAFSFSLIDLALDALCRRPDLWDRSDSDADAFILRAADLADPASSPAFKILASVPGLAQRAKHFAAICVSPFERIPAFEAFLAGRYIPAVSVVFSGDATLPLRRRYVSIYDIVDATNFARCCAHVGDRVELIGQIVRVVMSPEPPLDTACLYVEFAEHSHDMVCLKIWPDALARLEEAPDQAWVGHWICAIGLVDPVCSAGSGAQRRKDVSISITEPSQLHRLTEAEARYRLHGNRRTTAAALDTTAGVTTDRVVTDAAPQPYLSPPPDSELEPQLKPIPTLQPAPPPPPLLRAPIDGHSPSSAAPLPPVTGASGPPARVGVNAAPRTLSRWPWWVAAAMIAFLGVYIIAFLGVDTSVSMRASRAPVPETHPASAADRSAPAATSTVRPAQAGIDASVSMRASRAPVPETHPASEAGQSAPAAVSTARPAQHGVASRLESQQNLSAVPQPIETAAGTLLIGTTEAAGRARVVLLNGAAIPGLRDDAITLAHRAVFSDREVVVGFTQCHGPAAPCGLNQPFWLELRAGSPPHLWRMPGLWAGTGAGSVTATDGGVQVDLGVANGERRRATLTAAGDIVVSRRPKPTTPLDGADCATVIQAAEACAASRDCRSFASSARSISPSQWARLTQLYYESTGLNAAAFRALCVRSCQLGLTPSTGFIRGSVCSGAQSDQWPPGDPAAGWIR